jgi:hypothetical protein
MLGPAAKRSADEMRNRGQSDQLVQPAKSLAWTLVGLRRCEAPSHDGTPDIGRR